MTHLAGFETILVIGYGNTLRGDDGLGPHVAGMIGALGLANVKIRIVQQLLPELAADLAEVRRVHFIDACLGDAGEDVRLIAIHPAGGATVTGHVADAQGLLALTQAVYGRVPQAWLVSVPGEQFELCESLSAAAAANARLACRTIHELIASFAGQRGD